MTKFFGLLMILAVIVGGCVAYDYIAQEVQVYTAQEDAKQQQIDKLLTREQELQLELDLLQTQLQLLQEENEKLQLELQLERAKSDLELAQGQRSILEASAKTVDTNRWLVSWNAVRGDMILIVVLLFLLLVIVIAAVFGMSIYIRTRRRDRKMEIILPTYKVR